MKIYILIISLLIFIGCNGNKGGTTFIDKINQENNLTIKIENNVTIKIENNLTIKIENNNTSSDTNNNSTLPIDITPPTIKLSGDINISVPQGEAYIELGASALDNNVAIGINIDGFVDVDSLGEYILTYTATDSANNSASISRRVIVEANRVRSTIVETIPSNWYIRIIAKDLTSSLKTENTQLGVLEGDNIPSKHSLKALAPFGSSYLDVVFINPQGLDIGEYKTSFYGSSSSLYNMWNMRVKTDNDSATIEISWRGLYIVTPYVDEYNRTRYTEKQSYSNPLIQYMKLIDVSSGKEIPAIYDAKVQKYKFNMNGTTTKDFQWVVSDYIVDINISSQMPRILRRARVVNSPSDTTIPIKIPIEPFDMFNVPKSDTFDRYTR